VEVVACTAWDAYLALTRELLPALADERIQPAVLASRLGGVGVRIVRHAPLWGEHGPMLVAALCSALDLYGAGDRQELVELLHTVANRLYVLSGGSR
jgi:hypothetical protein